MRAATSQDQIPVTSGVAGKTRGPMAVMTTLFFLSGFLAALNDILIPHLKSIFDLNYAEAMLVQFSFFSAFLIFAVPAGVLVERAGYKKTIVTGLLTMGSGALLFIPAANLPSFAVFMCALMVLAGGITALQVSGNPYVSGLGPAHTASSRLTLTQAFNSLGSTIAPYVGGLLILSGTTVTMEQVRRMPAAALQAHRLSEAAAVKAPYLGIAIALVLLGLLIALYDLPAIKRTAHVRLAGDSSSVWRHRHLVLGAVGIFVAVGSEVAIGSFLVNYFSSPEIGAITARTAAGYVSLYWAGSMIGRFTGSFVMRRLPATKVLGTAALIVLALVITSTLTLGHAAMWSILAVGFFNSIMFPTIFTMGIAELGPLTGKGSGILMAAAIGGAIVPVLQGLVADRIGVHHSFVVPAMSYIFIAFYGFNGSTPGRYWGSSTR
ncbi:MAG: sugar MFS transporter [Bryobacteraceae bacterium]